MLILGLRYEVYIYDLLFAPENILEYTRRIPFNKATDCKGICSIKSVFRVFQYFLPGSGTALPQVSSGS